MSLIRPIPLLVALLLSTSALAQTLARTETQQAASATDNSPLKAFRGSMVSYSHTATALTLAPGAEPFYDPTWVHRLSLLPTWSPNPNFYIRGRIFISQEFTLSDSSRYKNEVEFSDISADFGTPGWTEPVTKIRIGGDVRLSAPTSKFSWSIGRVTTVAPTVRVSRSFPVMSGLFVSYTGRVTARFNRFSNSQNASPSISACGDAAAQSCAEFLTTGVRTPYADITHGPMVVFSPHPNVSINAVYFMVNMFLPTLDPTPQAYAGAQGLARPDSTNMRFLNAFDLSASWTVAGPLTLSLGASTFAPQLGQTGERIFPLFNRFTTLYLDASFDVEATVAKFL